MCKLNKAIYGLKQAPRPWFERLKATSLKFGFTDSKCDPSLFIYKTSSTITYILVYVDDIITTVNSSSLVHKLIQKLNASFSLKQLGSNNCKGALHSGLILYPASLNQHLSIRGFCDSD